MGKSGRVKTPRMVLHVLPIFCLFGFVDLAGDHLASFHQLKERTDRSFNHECFDGAEPNFRSFLNRQALFDSRNDDHPSMAARHLLELRVLSEKDQFLF